MESKVTIAADRTNILSRPGLVLGAICLLIHVFANQHYGYFRDELYFIVCGRHPAWGYVDQPPLIPLIAGFADWLAPGSLLALRSVPAIFAAATVVATVWLTRRIGGGAFAQWLAGICALVAPFYLSQGLILITDLFMPLAWTGCAALLIDMLLTRDYRRWIWIGVIAGLTLWSKYLILFDLAALALAIPFTPLRRSLLTPWPYLAGLIAIVIILPNALWQWHHGWPFLELGAAGVAGKNTALSLPQYLFSEILLMNPAATLVWGAGLAAMALAPRWSLYRVFALQYAALVLIEVALHGKDYYIASLYPPLFAVGAAVIEATVRPVLARGVLFAAIALVGVIGAPLAIPILPVDRFIAYQDRLGIKPIPMERRDLAALPQIYADMFGWREMAKAVSDAYWALPENERAKAVFLGGNYGEAAAIDVFGDRLPPSIAGHNNYFIWGPRGHDGAVIIRLFSNMDFARASYARVDVVGKLDNPYAMPDETNLYVVLCRDRKSSLIADWPQFKNYN